MRIRPFIQTVSVSPEMLRDPVGERYLPMALARRAQMSEARGPRGGRYRLLPAEGEWQHEPDFFTDKIVYALRRQGVYQRPSRRKERVP